MKRISSRRRAAFSLIELMVSTAVLSLLLVLIFQILKGMQTTWKHTRRSVGEFKDARQGFEEVSRRTQQAALNTYFAYRMEKQNIQGGGGTRWMGREIIQQSELQFVCGPAKQLGIEEKRSPQVGKRYTHAVFFMAPFGFCIDPKRNTSGSEELQYEKMNGLLNAWGYYIEFNTDELDRPSFLVDVPNTPLPRPRYRLMEFRQPTEYVQIYKLNMRDKTKAKQTEVYEWFNKGLYSVNSDWNTTLQARSTEGFFRTTRVVAENIIAMVLRPREADEGANRGTTGGGASGAEPEEDLAPDFLFDSRRFMWSTGKMAERTKHHLPPVIDITFVAVDEASFNNLVQREAIRTAEDDPKLVEGDMFVESKSFRKDLKRLDERLREKKLEFRVFTTSIRLRESKWLDADEAKKTGATP